MFPCWLPVGSSSFGLNPPELSRDPYWPIPVLQLCPGLVARELWLARCSSDQSTSVLITRSGNHMQVSSLALLSIEFIMVDVSINNLLTKNLDHLLLRVFIVSSHASILIRQGLSIYLLKFDGYLLKLT